VYMYFRSHDTIYLFKGFMRYDQMMLSSAEMLVVLHNNIPILIRRSPRQ
jgi:hypothetical protein